MWSRFIMSLKFIFQIKGKGQCDICHLHKPGGTAVAPDQLQKCISLSKKHSKSVQKLIEAASNVQLERNKQT